MLLIGSKALEIHSNLLGKQLLNRTAHNYDFICSIEQMNEFLTNDVNGNFEKKQLSKNKFVYSNATDKYIFTITKNYHTNEVYEVVTNNPVFYIQQAINNQMVYVANPDVCLMLKMSHRLKESMHFKKTLDDIKLLNDNCYYSIHSDLDFLYSERVRLTYKNSKKINVLTQTDLDEFTKDVDERIDIVIDICNLQVEQKKFKTFEDALIDLCTVHASKFAFHLYYDILRKAMGKDDENSSSGINS